MGVLGVDTHHPHPNPLPSREREFLCVCGGSTSRWRSCRTSFTGIYRINRMGVLGVDTHHPHPNPLPSREREFLCVCGRFPGFTGIYRINRGGFETRPYVLWGGGCVRIRIFGIRGFSGLFGGGWWGFSFWWWFDRLTMSGGGVAVGWRCLLVWVVAGGRVLHRCQRTAGGHATISPTFSCTRRAVVTRLRAGSDSPGDTSGADAGEESGL